LSAEKSYADGVTAVANNDFRIVSGAIYAFYEGAALDSSGRFCVGSDSRVAFNDASCTVSTTGTDVLNTYQQSSDIPVNQAKKTQPIARYIPQDKEDLVYGPVTSYTANETAHGVSVIIVDGLPNGAMIEFWIVENYELIPRDSVSSLVVPTPSDNDPMDMALTSNAVSSTPQISVLPPARLVPSARQEIVSNLPPNGHRVGVESNKPDMGVMDSFFDLIEKGTSAVDSALPGIAKAAPLLLSLL
jgi:hypothetical protein